MAVASDRLSAEASALEAATQRIGRRLVAAVRAQPEPPSEWLQDRFLAAIAQDATLRTSLLRFVDVLAALGFDRTGALTTRLAREYVRQPVQHLPRPFGALPTLALQAPAPPLLVRAAALRATTLVADRFIVRPGAGARAAMANLRRAGLVPSFDVLGEHVVSTDEADAFLQRYLELIEQLGRLPEAGATTLGGVRALQVSVKLSALTARFDPADPAGTLARVRAPLAAIVEQATAAGVAVTIDMEEYRLRELTWSIFQAMFGRDGPFWHWPDAGIVLQAYLVDAPEQAHAYVRFARERQVPFQVRLVKGAYWDFEAIVANAEGWPAPVLRQKAATDAQFEAITETLAAAYPTLRLAVGSHNLRSHAHAEAVRVALRLPAAAIEHQTLYGMAPHVGRALRRQGWPVREYVPIGELLAGMSYLVRRILENSSQTGFLLQSRRGARYEELLRPPTPAAWAAPSTEMAATFKNTPPLRLFLAAEREPFEATLAAADAAPAARFPLDLPDLGEPRPWLRPCNPSRPDQERPAVEVEAATEADIEPALARLDVGRAGWAARSLGERAAILRRAATLLLDRRDAFAAAMVLEGGKNWSNALGDVDEAVDYLRFYPWLAERLGERLERHAPRGIVAVIPPWNFPLAIPCGMTAAALLTGNTVALKPAEQTPGITARLTALLYEAGVPRDALLHLPGDGEQIGGALVRDPLVDMVAFTGSRDVGLWIAETAATLPAAHSGLKHVVAEMGGKNAIAVFPDADLDEAVEGILVSTFGHANQKCSACSRVFAHQAIFPKLRKRLAEGARSLPVGAATAPATIINPLIDAAAVERVRVRAAEARREGKVVLDLMDAPGRDCGYCLGPLLVELPPTALIDARTAQEEIFGPVLALAPFSSEAEALAQINGVAYGLTAGVYSRSPSTIKRMTAGIRTGNIYVNREITGARVGVEPFGGMGMSGTGPKAGGEDYLYAFVRQQDGRRGEGTSAGTALALHADYLATSAATLGNGEGAPAANTIAPSHWPTVNPWSTAAAERRHILAAAAAQLASGAAGPAPADVVVALRQALAQANEVLEPTPALPLPGQHTVLDHTLPRGRGLVIVDETAFPASLGALAGAALLAGNGVVLAVPSVLARGTAALAEALWRAGVPRDVLALLPEGMLPDEPPVDMFDFIAADVALPRARHLAASLARRHAGQRGIPAFLSAADAPAPGDPGFVRRFTLARTIAIRTLRHGADLGVV